MAPSSSNGNVQRTTDSFQKHLQTGFQVIMVTIVLSVGGAVISMRDSVIRQEEHNKRIDGAILDLKADVALLRMSIAGIAEKNTHIAQDIRDIEGKLGNLERDRRRGRNAEGP